MTIQKTSNQETIISGTWNSASAYNGVIVDILDVSSNATSDLLDLRVSGLTRANVTKGGMINTTSSVSAAGSIYATTLSATTYQNLPLASYATTASLANYATTALYETTAYARANYDTTAFARANYATTALYATTASLANYATTALYDTTAFARANYATTALYATTASLANYATTALYATTASLANYATTANYVSKTTGRFTDISGTSLTSINTYSQGVSGQLVSGTTVYAGTVSATNYLNVPVAGTANQVVYKDATNVATGSANLTFDGTNLSVNGNLKSTNSIGDEGGEIFLNKAVTNTTLNGGVTIDVYQNKLRFFEQGGTARGYYIDITTGGGGVATNLVGATASLDSYETTAYARANYATTALYTPTASLANYATTALYETTAYARANYDTTAFARANYATTALYATTASLANYATTANYVSKTTGRFTDISGTSLTSINTYSQGVSGQLVSGTTVNGTTVSAATLKGVTLTCNTLNDTTQGAAISLQDSVYSIKITPDPLQGNGFIGLPATTSGTTGRFVTLSATTYQNLPLAAYALTASLANYATTALYATTASLANYATTANYVSKVTGRFTDISGTNFIGVNSFSQGLSGTNVSGTTIRASTGGGYYAGANPGITSVGAIEILDGDGTTLHSLVFTNGLLTSYSRA